MSRSISRYVGSSVGCVGDKWPGLAGVRNTKLGSFHVVLGVDAERPIVRRGEDSNVLIKQAVTVVEA
jgi:hypothetical protein